MNEARNLARLPPVRDVILMFGDIPVTQRVVQENDLSQVWQLLGSAQVLKIPVVANFVSFE